MKRILAMFLVICFWVCGGSAAWANQGGLHGGLLELVGENWADYLSVSDDGADRAVLEKQNHRVLLAGHTDAESGQWVLDTVSTTAVYQPEEERGDWVPVLTPQWECFVMTYADEESYEFVWEDGRYVLSRVSYGQPPYSDGYIRSEGGYSFWQSGMANTFTPIGEAELITGDITLAAFNISQMPRSLEEVRRSSSILYLGGETDLLDIYPDLLTEDADFLDEKANEALNMMNTPIMAAVDTFLTNDPFGAQVVQKGIPSGSEMTLLAYCGAYYVYVQWDGEAQPVRGFVPIKDLHPKYDLAISFATEEILYTDSRWDVMDALIGKWTLANDQTPQINQTMIILECGGSFRTRNAGDAGGNFRVADGKDGKYEIWFCAENNEEASYGMTLENDGIITLIDADGKTVRMVRDEYSTQGNG